MPSASGFYGRQAGRHTKYKWISKVLKFSKYNVFIVLEVHFSWPFQIKCILRRHVCRCIKFGCHFFMLIPAIKY